MRRAGGHQRACVDLATGSGHRLEYEVVASPDFSLEDHWQNGEARRAIARGRWDFIVLQQGPSALPESRSLLVTYAKRFDEEARKVGQDPARLVFGHTNFSYFTPFKDRADAEAVQQRYFQRNMGDRRDWDHLRECYFTGTLADQITRLEDLAEAGLDYMVFGPLSAEPSQIDVLGEELLPRFG